MLRRFVCSVCSLSWSASQITNVLSGTYNTYVCKICATKQHNQKPQGQTMATKNKTIELSNGDTPEFVRVDIGYSVPQELEIIRGLIKLTLSGAIFDFKRKCWFVPAEHIDAFRAGIASLISTRVLAGWGIKDSRETLEAFEEFFEKQAPAGKVPESKETLIQKFISSCASGDVVVDYGILNLNQLQHVKPYYRKAALALHPDRNNGDGSRMSELNAIWVELQVYLK